MYQFFIFILFDFLDLKRYKFKEINLVKKFIDIYIFIDSIMNDM